MTQEEFDKSPLLDQILYDCTGMLVENHKDIAEAMQKYASEQLRLAGVRLSLLDKVKEIAFGHGSAQERMIDIKALFSNEA